MQTATKALQLHLTLMVMVIAQDILLTVIPSGGGGTVDVTQSGTHDNTVDPTTRGDDLRLISPERLTMYRTVSNLHC